jgi:hypothetical protein
VFKTESRQQDYASDVLGVDEKMKVESREWWNGRGNTDQQQLAYLGRVGGSARRALSRLRNAGCELQDQDKRAHRQASVSPLIP